MAKQSSHLTQHELVHSYEHKFCCNLCPYKAKRKAHLNNHFLTHSDVYGES